MSEETTIKATTDLASVIRSESTTEVKPGYKTTEFWLCFAAAIVAFVQSSGIVVEGGNTEKVVGLIVTGLTAMGYSVSRAITKKSA